jgi:hypothetical protein
MLLNGVYGMDNLTAKQKEFFWGKVKKGERCWSWLRGCYSAGYGQFKAGGKGYAAHRLSYEISVGPIPEGMCVLHKCDNPPCVNPDHLFLGTQKENMQDCVNKKRHFSTQTKGSRHPNGKLTDDEVREIRKKEKKQKEYGEIYGMTQAAISAIQKRLSYASVT